MLLVNRRMDMCGAHGHVPEYMSMFTTHVHVRWTWKCALVMSMCAGHGHVSQRMPMLLVNRRMDMCGGHGHVPKYMSMSTTHVHVRWACPCPRMAMCLSACPCYRLHRLDVAHVVGNWMIP